MTKLERSMTLFPKREVQTKTNQTASVWVEGEENHGVDFPASRGTRTKGKEPIYGD